MKKKIYKIQLLFKDLKYEKNTFLCTIVIIFLVNFCFVCALNLIEYYNKSIENVKNRLGADIVVVSKEYDSQLKDSLFLGTPSTIEFNSEKIFKLLKKQKNVKNISSQLFLSSLKSSCCDEKLQFILYDSRTDNLVTSWINKYESQVEGRNIIIGNDINYDIGDKVTFFDVVFCVAGKLSKTGMGYDNCIFLDEKSSESLIKFWGEKNIENKSSLLLIQLENKNEIDSTLNEINKIVKGNNLIGYKSKELYKDISQKISDINIIVNLFILIIFVISGISLYVINAMKIQDKKKDMELLKIWGVKKNAMLRIILTEQFMISVIGSIIGDVCALLFIIIFRNNLQQIINAKVRIGLEIMFVCIIGLTITLIISFASSICSMNLLKRNQDK